MRSLILICLAAVALAVTACGESKEDKAKKQVCSASSDIQKQVTQLQSLTVQTATVNGVKDSLNAINSDLQKISDAQGDLNSERKQQVQAANQEFTSQVKSIANEVGTSLSASAAQAQLKAAGQQLATAYQNTFAKVDCS